MILKKYNPFIAKFTTQVFDKDVPLEKRKENTEYSRFSLISNMSYGELPDDADLNEIAIINDGLYIFDNRTGVLGWHAIMGGVGGYTHPITHPALMITEDSDRIWFTPEERSKLSNIEDNSNQFILTPASVTDLGGIKIGSRLTVQTDGTLSANLQSEQNFNLTYKQKLDSISFAANNYTLPISSLTTLGGIKVGDRLNIDSNGIVSANIQTDQNYTLDEKLKLITIDSNANYYVHPVTHIPEIISQNPNYRFVTDHQITEWDDKISGPITDDDHGELNGGKLHTEVTDTVAGFMTPNAKIKLATIETGANFYEHPASHPPTIITQNSNFRFINDNQILAWNNKIDLPLTDITHGVLGGADLHANATQWEDGFMSYQDKVKIDGLVFNNQFVHPLTHSASMITETLDRIWFTHDEHDKLDGIENNANRYTHPFTHPATMIIQDTSHKFVTDIQISNWDSKTVNSYVDGKVNSLLDGVGTSLNTLKKLANAINNDSNYWITIGGLINNKVDKVSGKALSTNDFTNTYKTKLDGIEANANNYIHPTSHPADIIIQDTFHKFVGDNQIAYWNAKADVPITDLTHGSLSGGILHSLVTSVSAGFMSIADKNKLNNIENNANNYIHPTSHSAAIITETVDRFWFTPVEKTKLDGIETNANKYIHPSTHPASIIIEDSTHRFLTDGYISSWNNKIDSPLTNLTHENLSGGSLHSIVTTTVNGFSSYQDKVKLNGIEVSANNYIHPTSHLASIIEEDPTRRFVTDGQIEYWDDKISGPLNELSHGNLPGGFLHALATNIDDGFLSYQDKIKLNGIEVNANNYIHPVQHPGSIIVEDSNHRWMTDADKSKLNGIETNANNYIHPIGDGNLHVPATGTTSNKKILTAGPTPGSMIWEENVSGVSGIIDCNCDPLVIVNQLVIPSASIDNFIESITDNRSTFPVIGIVISKVTPTLCKVLMTGQCDSNFNGLQRGKKVFVAEDGGLTTDVPLTGYVQCIGTCNSDGKLYVRINPTRIKRNPF